MKFIQAHIHGFGKWIDTPFTFNEHGLTCIVGDNESGKSTFQTFISFMLFGLPPKKREFYRPRTSGTLGGELIVQLENGERVTIRRFDGQKNGAATCIRASGEEKDEQWLQSILKGMTEVLFASTFQFTTEDLYAFQQIEVDQISEVLLNASISGASHLRQVEKDLEQKMDDLFKPRGSRPVINEQLNKLNELQQKVHAHRHMQENHQSLSETTQKQTNKINKLQQQIDDVQKNIIRWEQVEKALPYIQQYEQAEKLLDELQIISFNEAAPDHLADQNRARQKYESNRIIIQKNIDRYIEEMNDISLLDQEIVEEGNTIIQEKEKWSYHTRVQNDLQREKETIQTEINTKMNPYIRILTPETIEELDIPPFIDKKWRGLARKAERLDGTRLDQANIVKEEKNTLESLQQKITESSADILSKDKYNDVQDKLKADEQARSNERYVQTIEQEKTAQLNDLQTSYQQSIKTLIGMNVLALVFGVIAFFSQITWLYHGMIISAVIGWGQWYFRRKEYMKTDDAEQQIDRSQEKILEENERIFLQEQLDAHARATDSVAFYTREKEEAERSYAQVEQKLVDLEKEEQGLNASIEDEVLRYPFLDRIELEDWEEVGHLLHDIQSLQLKLADTNHKLAEINQAIEWFEQKVRTWWKTIFNKPVYEAIVTILSSIEQQLDNDMKARQRHEKIHFEKEQAMDEKNKLNNQIEYVDQEIKTIFESANVTTEEAFYQQHERYMKQLENLDAIREAKQDLMHIFSPSTWDAYLHQDIESRMIEYELINSHKQIDTYKESLEEARSVLATASAEQTHMEQTDSLSYSERMHMFEMEKEELQELSKKWAIYEVAHSTLQKAKQTYMSKHLDAVIQRATEHFAYITNNRYVHIHVDMDEEKIRVENNQHLYYSPQELSKGTQDQLYIAMRLAMSEHIQKKSPMPFIFDDTFVHFDKKRTKQMIKQITHLTQEHQVILFTCKDEIKQMVDSYRPKYDISSVRID